MAFGCDARLQATRIAATTRLMAEGSSSGAFGGSGGFEFGGGGGWGGSSELSALPASFSLPLSVLVVAVLLLCGISILLVGC